MERQEPLQISPGQLQSELESIRSLRRISLSQSSPDLDPDLPSSLQNNLIMNNNDNPINNNNLTTTLQQPASNPNSSSSSTNNQPVDQATDEPHPDLFWLPARLHPEIAPQEFKAFIEEATKPENLLRRTSSALGSRRNSINSSGLSRKKSMLSQVYDPTEDQHLLSSSLPRPDKPITRGYSMSSPRNLGRGAQGLESLTINDLQRLESLVFKKSPSSSNEPSLDTQFHHLNLNDDRIRAVISRSKSIGGSANLPCGSELSPEQLDPEAIDDSPLISRAPGHIIRRTARTKVRKKSLPGDGNGHRFPATRRTQAKSSMANSHHPRTDSTTSNDSEEALSNDLHSNRSSKECARQSLPGSSICTEDPTHAIDAHRSLPVPLAGAKSTTPGTLDHSSEDDHSLDSTSRPGSLASNNSLLDAYAYEGPLTDDPLKLTVHPSSFEFSDLIAPSNLDYTVPHPIKYPGKSSSSELPHPRPVQAPSSDLICKPSSTEPGNSPPDASKPDALRVSTDLHIPVLQRSIRSSDDLNSASVSANSAVSSSTAMTFSTATSSSTLASSSPTTPVGPQTSRPPLTTTKTSPNLSTPATSAIPSPQASSSPGPKEGKEGKEKKRAWVKLGLSSAVSTSSKNKKGKAKDKQKAVEPDGSTSGQPVTVAPAGGSNNGGAIGVGLGKKETGFLSGLFGGKSRKNESDQEKQTSSGGPPGLTGNPKHPSAVPGGAVGLGRASAETQAQQQLINPTASGGYIKGRFMSFYRLPIHVERAVYRLSHIKLANPRRPLYEQVLISNLMFWYLGVINKSQAAAPIKNNNINTSHQPVSSSSSSSSSSSPSPSGSSKRQQGNARTGKAKNNHSNVPSSHHTQQNQRNPGVKKWGNNKGGDEEKANGKSKATVGRKGPKKVRSGWTDGDSSSSDSSDEDDRPRHSGRRQADQDSSDSDSDSADHLQSSSDDDEKPLGTRIRSKHITMPNSSPQSTAPLLPSSSSDLIR